jgi:hypothetical protein
MLLLPSARTLKPTHIPQQAHAVLWHSTQHRAHSTEHTAQSTEHTRTAQRDHLPKRNRRSMCHMTRSDQAASSRQHTLHTRPHMMP